MGTELVRANQLVLFASVLLTLHCFTGESGAQEADLAADRLMRDAVVLAEQGERATPGEALPLLRGAREYLARIIEDHPRSRLASRLVLGDPLIRRVEAAIMRAEGQIDQCWRVPNRNCMIELARVELAGGLTNVHTELQLPRIQSLLGMVQMAAGQADAADRSFTEATAVARTISAPWLRGHALGEIVAALVHSRRFGDAVKLAASVEAPHWRDGVFNDVAWVQSDLGDFEAALATAAQIEEVPRRAMVMWTIAEDQAIAGQAQAAQQTFGAANAISAVGEEGQTSFSWAILLATAIMQAESGQQSKSKETFRIALDAALKLEGSSRRLRALAVAQCRFGEIDDALATTIRIEDKATRASAVADIARATADSGRIEQAKKLVARFN